MKRSLATSVALLVFSAGCYSSVSTPTVTTVKVESTSTVPQQSDQMSSDAEHDVLDLGDSGTSDLPASMRPADVKAKPIAVLEDNVFDFGTMEPHQRRIHTFVVRNEGTAPLELREGKSSCKCTIGDVGDNEVAPGEQTVVTLSWRSGEGNRDFAHEAEVLTNDPDSPVLRCRIEGRILSRLLIEPKELAMPGVQPGVAEQSTVTLSTQIWDSFEIKDIRCSMEGMQWNLERLTEEERKTLQSNDGYRITVTTPDDLPEGYFKHNLKFRVQPKDNAEKVYELPVTGKVLRRISIYGKGINAGGTIKLGKVQRGKGLKRFFNIKVRDQNPVLEVKKVDTMPDFMRVSLVDNGHAATGLYRMLLEIPKTAPQGTFIADPGKVHIEFENKRFDDIDLNVEFVISGSD